VLPRRPDLGDLREARPSPPEWPKRVPEVVPGYPDRLLPVDEDTAEESKKRTLTNLYNERPLWLAGRPGRRRDPGPAVRAEPGTRRRRPLTARRYFLALRLA
jgi:hypothetical protein